MALHGLFPLPCDVSERGQSKKPLRTGGVTRKWTVLLAQCLLWGCVSINNNYDIGRREGERERESKFNVTHFMSHSKIINTNYNKQIRPDYSVLGFLFWVVSSVDCFVCMHVYFTQRM